MRSLDELDVRDRSAIGAIGRWVAAAETPCEILSPSEERERVLLTLQIATDQVLGAMAFETGGILVDSGWLRYLGSGNPRLPRNLADWNVDRAAGMRLVADDVVGGFFAVNAGAFGDGADMYYWAPDSLQWEPIGFEFDFFLRWSLTSALADFYQHVRWSGWQQEIADRLPADHCFFFEPPLWETKGARSSGWDRTLSVAELYALKQAAQQRAS